MYYEGVKNDTKEKGGERMAIKKKQPNASLKALRASYGLSMLAMSKILGISETSYMAKENNKRDWRSSEMFMMRKYFNLSLDEIFFGREVS